jgi:hypothetical protein
MTYNKSKAYMKEHNLLKYWLLPLEKLQAGTRYNDSIPGDSPELMPLDDTLNQDIHSSARYHVAITSHLPKDDPRKFSFATPKEISRTSALWTNTLEAPAHLDESSKTVRSG